MQVKIRNFALYRLSLKFVGTVFVSSSIISSHVIV